MRIALGQCRHLRRVYCRERLGILGTLERQHAADSLERGCLGGQRRHLRRQHCHVDRAAPERGRAADALGGADIEPAVAMLGDDEDLRHQSTPRCFMAPNSSSTLLTMMPRERTGGGANFTARTDAAAGSTPSAARVVVSSGFFFAFMMSGSLM